MRSVEYEMWVRTGVEKRVGDRVWGQVGVRVWDRVRNEVWDEVGGRVLALAERQVRNEVRDNA